MEEESKHETKQEMKGENKVISRRTPPHEYQYKRSKEDMKRFPGKGYRLGSS